MGVWSSCRCTRSRRHRAGQASTLTKYGVLYKKSAITHGAITPQKVAPIREHSPDDWRLYRTTIARTGMPGTSVVSMKRYDE